MTSAQEQSAGPGDDSSRFQVERVLRGDAEEDLDATSAQWMDRIYEGGEEGAAAEARADVEEILGGVAFRDETRSWSGEFWEWLDELLSHETEVEEAHEPRTANSPVMSEAMFDGLVVALVLTVVVILLTRYVKQRRRDESKRGTAAEAVASRVAELRARARVAAEAGDWVEALRLDFFALVIGLGERGDLQYRDAWTNRELLERGQPGVDLERSLRPVVRRLDAHSFGRLPSGPAEVSEFRSFCDRMLKGRA